MWLVALPFEWMRFLRAWRTKRIRVWRDHPDSLRVSPVRWCSAMLLALLLLLAHTFVGPFILYVGINSLDN